MENNRVLVGVIVVGVRLVVTALFIALVSWLDMPAVWVAAYALACTVIVPPKEMSE